MPPWSATWIEPEPVSNDHKQIKCYGDRLSKILNVFDLAPHPHVPTFSNSVWLLRNNSSCSLVEACVQEWKLLAIQEYVQKCMIDHIKVRAYPAPSLRYRVNCNIYVGDLVRYFWICITYYYLCKRAIGKHLEAWCNA